MRRCASRAGVGAVALVGAAVASARRHQSGSAFGREGEAAAEVSGEEARSSTAAATRAPAPYRRRSSDPQTLRERMDFRRDHKYGRHRPLPDVPWRQHKERTYLDDAERLYGRKETWHTIENDELREKLVAILQDYLRDSIASARLEIRDARKYQRLCDSCAREYRAHLIAGAFGSPDMLRDWANAILSQRNAATATSGGSGASEGDSQAHAGDDSVAQGDPSAAAASSGSDADPELEEWRERRRRRGAEVVLDGSVAVADLPERDTRTRPVSAFPFLRQRAVEDERSLDPSLVDWTAKYFPADDTTTFREPPQLRQRQASSADGQEGGDSSGDAAGEAPPPGEGRPSAIGRRPSAFGRSAGGRGGLPAHHARHRLHRSLRSHEDRHRATFDAEGVFYHVRQPSEEDERAPRPRPVRGSEVSGPGSRGAASAATAGVVKVPWNVVATSQKQGYTPDILRAKERLIRLSRGEDPETIP